MARAVYVQLHKHGGTEPEAVALAKHEGQLLPPGRWKIRHQDGREELMSVEDMPFHWREQLHEMGEFGKQL